MNSNPFYLLQLILSVLLIMIILLQVKGTGLGSTFGSSLGFYRSRRGVEKLLFYATVVVSLLFLLTSITRLII